MIVSGDLEGSVYLWRPAPHCTSSQGKSTRSYSQRSLVGSYRHKDWVRSVSEVDGLIASCCKSGEIKLATVAVICDDDAFYGEAEANSRPRDSSEQQQLGGEGCLQVQSTWDIGGRPADSVDTEGSGGGAGQYTGSVSNQAFSLAMDISGIVAGCQDKGIRQFMFTRDGSVMIFA